MALLRNSFLCLLSASLALAGWKLCFLFDQASIVLADAQSVIAQAGPQLVGASIELRAAAREQRSYYKATGKALAIDMIQAGRLIEHADSAVQDLDRNTIRLIGDADVSQKTLTAILAATLKDTDEQIDANGEALRLTLAAARGNFEQAESLWPPLVKSAQSMTRSGENVEQATESVRMALEPLRKPTGRLQFVLHWLLGLPHFNIRP